MLIGCLFAACQQADEVKQISECEVMVNLLVETPGTRIGDPGTGHDENAILWENIDLFFVYSKEDRVIKKSLLRKDYEASKAKKFLFTLPVGNVDVYAVAYGKQQKPLQTATPEQVRTLRTNDLMDMKEPKFTEEDRKKYLLGLFSAVINQPLVLQSGKAEMLTLTLKRLIAKVDIQWDAQEAYEGFTYTDVALSDMHINGITQGYFFPQQQTDLNNPELTENIAAYTMNTPASKRNGRAYFYVFAGVKNQIRFNVVYQQVAEAGSEPKTKTVNYTAAFQQPLKQASWHKVNLNVKGTQIPQSGTNVIIKLSQNNKNE